MKVLVTGSSGFIGSALVSALRKRGTEVHGVDVRAPRWRDVHPLDHVVDIVDRDQIADLLARIEPTKIVHLAARTDLSKDSVVKYGTNIDGVLHLAYAVSRTPSVERVLWTSSQLVSRVGRVPAYDTDYDPDTSYGESKVITERIVRGLDGGGVPWSILRPTTVWGPGMSDHYLSLLRYLERRRYFHAGAACIPKSYSYIYNAVHQMEHLLRAPLAAIHRKTFYIADYLPIDMRGWCDALSRALCVRPAPVVPVVVARMMARTGDMLNATIMPGFKFTSFRLRNILTPYVFDTMALEQITGKLPHDHDAAVNQTIAWYREFAQPVGERRG